MGKAYTLLSKSFGATISKKGRMAELLYNSPKWFRHELNKYQDGDSVSVTLTNKKLKRTENQNRYYWLYLGLIAQETGEHDIDRLHELFKGKFLTKEIVKVLGHDVRVKKSTTELSAGQFSDYIADIYGLTGIMPPPIDYER